KDRSNVWESWMPTVILHVETWTTSFQDSQRGVFMTPFTEDMVSGQTSQSTEGRPALGKLYEEGKLHFAINIIALCGRSGGAGPAIQGELRPHPGHARTRLESGSLTLI